MTFIESGLCFEFNQNWVVKAYDRHTYFQGFSGVGLKAVDFVGIYKGTQLVLFEIKNYQRRKNQRQAADPPYWLEDPQLLIDTFYKKTEDTQRAIRAIQAYYARNWLYRLALPIIYRLPTQKNDRIFWTHAAKILQNTNNLHLVFWLELPDIYAPFYPTFENLLPPSSLIDTAKVYLANRETPAFPNDLQVSSPKTTQPPEGH